MRSGDHFLSSLNFIPSFTLGSQLLPGGNVKGKGNVHRDTSKPEFSKSRHMLEAPGQLHLNRYATEARNKALTNSMAFARRDFDWMELIRPNFDVI